MKMWMLALVLLILTGCSGPAWETVDDQIPAESVEVWQQEAYTISAGLPEGAVLISEEAGVRRYRVDETGLEVESRVFLAWSPEAAVRMLSGKEADEMTILETTRFGLPQYQFAWYDASTGRLCRADLVLDGMTGYVLVCSLPEAQGADLAVMAQPVFGAFGLHTDEGV